MSTLRAISVARVFLLAPLVPAARGSAQEAPAAAGAAAKLTLDLGLVNAAGNTNVTTLNAGDALEVKAAAWRVAQFATVVYGRIGDSTTAEQVKLSGRFEYRLVSVVHGFVGVTYERNRFAGITRRFEEFAGVALMLVDRSSDVWSLEAGSSVNQKRTTAGIRDGFLAVRVATAYRHQFTRAAYVGQTAEVLPNMEMSDDVLVNSETSLVAPLGRRVALKLSYAIKFDNLPEPGFRKTDRVLTSGLQIVF